LRARVFPIQPGEERKVTLRYTQLLDRAGNALQLVYAGAVRGGDQASAPAGRSLPEPVETSFEIEIVEGSDFLEPFSPTHALSIRRDDGELNVSVEEDVVGRFSLFLPLAGDAIGLSVATHRPIGEDGYFMLTLSPDPRAGEPEPRDLTVVLDVSGSMSGEKIEQAKQALHELLGSLGSEDRFRLLAFSNSVRMQSADWSSVTRRRMSRAADWVDALAADGGTNIGAALDEAFRLESPEERLPVVIFLTDGLPSVGEQSPEALADRAEKRAGRARVFAFGVGHDVNTHLLDRLGEAGRGSTDYVQPGENVERVISLLAAKIQHPVLTDLRLSGGPIEMGEIFPVQVPDVFAGEQLVLFGRFEGDGQSQMTVRGRRGGTFVDYSTEHVFPESSEANAYIPRLWASRKLGHLERQLWTEGESSSLVDEMRTVALRYGLPSRYTSYLVEEPEMVADGPAPRGGRVGSFIRGLMPGSVANAPAAQSVGAGAASEASGEVAVRMADEARARRETSSTADIRRDEDVIMAELVASADASVPTKALGGRLFYFRDGVWTDSAHQEQYEVVQVKAYSTAYFDVLESLRELRVILKDQGSYMVAGEGLSLHFGDEGAEEMSVSDLAELVDGFRGEDGSN
jgi:Ca-activated chloride channel family protein